MSDFGSPVCAALCRMCNLLSLRFNESDILTLYLYLTGTFAKSSRILLFLLAPKSRLHHVPKSTKQMLLKVSFSSVIVSHPFDPMVVSAKV